LCTEWVDGNDGEDVVGGLRETDMRDVDGVIVLFKLVRTA